MSSDSRLLIYGATGYTGTLIAEEAVRRGLEPVLAGRIPQKVEALAGKLGCPHRSFPLGSTAQVARDIGGFKVVLHCAGPFSATARVMMHACIEARAHYLDITGEIDVIEAAAKLGPRATAAGIALIPAVGFDVVPTDCLAASLAGRLPDATHLELAFAGSGTLSRGTVKTMIESAPRGGRARVGGEIVHVPIAWKTRQVPFRAKTLAAMTIPWGDVASAFHSTGIRDIEVYAAASPRRIAALRRWRFLAPLSALPPVRWWLKRRAERGAPGPSPAELAAGRAWIWGRVSNEAGRSVEATMETPGGYRLTALTAVAAAERVLRGSAPRGFATPSRAFGKGFILELPGCDMRFEEERQRE